MQRNLVRKLIVGFGYLNGVWLAIGISPEDEVLHFLAPVVERMPEIIRQLFIWVPVALMAFTLITLFTNI